MSLRITPLKAFTDNYIWAIHNHQHCYVVDPGQSEPVSRFITEQRLTLSGILITHHHHDHVGGLEALQKQHKAPAWGPDDDRITGDCQVVSEGEELQLPALNTSLQVLFVPGHTVSHIVFYNNDWLFSGDTLFSLGCGRMFEGNPEMFVKSLAKIKALPDYLSVYCGHEYTRANARFALAVEPDSEAIRDYCQQIDQLRAEHKPSLPSRLGTEKKLNPFLRTDDKQFQQQVQSRCNQTITDSVDCFAALRQWKDDF